MRGRKAPTSETLHPTEAAYREAQRDIGRAREALRAAQERARIAHEARNAAILAEIEQGVMPRQIARGKKFGITHAAIYLMLTSRHRRELERLDSELEQIE